MKIGFDISILPLGRGVGKYIYELLKGYAAIDNVNEFRLFFNSPKSLPTNLNIPNFRIQRYRIPNKILSILWLTLRFPSIKHFIGDVDLFHSPAHSPVYAICPPAKNWIVTVHDLFTFKLRYKKKTRKKEMKILKLIEKEAAHIITVSESTKRDLLEIIPSVASRTSVIYEGIGEKYTVLDGYEQILNKYKLPDKYILFVGSADHNKNLTRLLDAFKNISNLIDYDLVLVGDLKWRYQKVIEYINAKRLKERVILPGYIKEEDLPAVYNGADLFVSPSLYEGFGLTLLEAMACGTPVITSNISSMPEIVGESGMLVDPYDTEMIGDAIMYLLENGSIRKKLIDEGLEHIKRFTWRNCAKATLDIYNKVYSTNV